MRWEYAEENYLHNAQFEGCIRRMLGVDAGRGAFRTRLCGDRLASLVDADFGEVSRDHVRNADVMGITVNFGIDVWYAVQRAMLPVPSGNGEFAPSSDASTGDNWSVPG